RRDGRVLRQAVRGQELRPRRLRRQLRQLPQRAELLLERAVPARRRVRQRRLPGGRKLRDLSRRLQLPERTGVQRRKLLRAQLCRQERRPERLRNELRQLLGRTQLFERQLHRLRRRNLQRQRNLRDLSDRLQLRSRQGLS